MRHLESHIHNSIYNVTHSRQPAVLVPRPCRYPPCSSTARLSTGNRQRREIANIMRESGRMGPNKPVQIRFYTLLSGRMDYHRGHVWDPPGCRRAMVAAQEEVTFARQHELAFFHQARNYRRSDPDHRPPGVLPNSNSSRHLV